MDPAKIGDLCRADRAKYQQLDSAMSRRLSRVTEVGVTHKAIDMRAHEDLSKQGRQNFIVKVPHSQRGTWAWKKRPKPPMPGYDS